MAEGLGGMFGRLGAGSGAGSGVARGAGATGESVRGRGLFG